MTLGPGVPDPPARLVVPPTQESRHRIGEHLMLRVKSVLGGLHQILAGAGRGVIDFLRTTGGRDLGQASRCWSARQGERKGRRLISDAA